MARVALTTQVVAEPSLTEALTPGTDVGATYTVDGDANELYVFNGSGAPVNVTVQTGGTIGGHTIADKVVAVAAGARARIPIRDKRVYLRPSGVTDGGKVYVDLSAVASVTAGAYR